MNLAIVDATADAAGQCELTGGPRSLTPIANLPLICHVLDELAEAGIDEAHIVGRASLRDEFERAVGDGQAWGMTVSYANAPETDGQQVVLSEIEQALAAGPVLVHPGDSLFPGQLERMLARFREGTADLVVLEPPNGTAARRQGGAEAERICDSAVVLGPETRSGIDELLAAATAGRSLIDTPLALKYRIATCELGDHWRYSSTTSALLTANRMLLDALPVPAIHADVGGGNTVEGRVAISPEARLANCTVHGPVVIDDGALLEDSYIGPYTAIGRAAAVTGAEIDNSMVLAAAEVQYPGQRIEGSIIAERASVVRSFDLPKGLHLRLAPGSRVTLT